MGKDIASTAQKWAVGIVGVFVLAVIAVSLFPLVTSQFKAKSTFDNSTCDLWNTTTRACIEATGVGCSDIPTNVTGIIDANCVTNSFTTFSAVVPVILVIVFLIALILGIVAMLKYSKHR